MGHTIHVLGVFGKVLVSRRGYRGGLVSRAKQLPHVRSEPVSATSKREPPLARANP